MKIDTAVILAGGKSIRMGFDKQLINVNGTPLTLRIAKELKEFFSEILIVTNTPELYVESGYKTIKDIYPGRGPLSGLHSGLYNSSSDFIYLTACDMPIISKRYIEFLKETIVSSDQLMGIVSKNNGFLEPMSGMYSKKLIHEIESLLVDGKYKFRDIIEKNSFHIVDEINLKELVDGEDIFLNLNTVEELNNYLDNNSIMD